MIYLEQVTPLAQTLIDSAQLDETGNYKLELCDVDRTPALYNLVCNGDKIPLFLQGGDRLTVSSVGRVVHNYTVEGSEESELLRRFYQPFVAGMQRLDALSSSPETYRMTDEEIRRIESEYWAEYRRIKREQIKFIVEHKSSLVPAASGRNLPFQPRRRCDLLPHGGGSHRGALSGVFLPAVAGQ